MIDVDIPLPGKKVQRKPIWYMVYRVRNIGYDFQPMLKDELPGLKISEIEEVNFKNRRFIPHFVLQSHEFKKQYTELLRAVRSIPLFSGWCYTQFTDTYQEANGLLYMDRMPKIPIEDIKKATSG